MIRLVLASASPRRLDLLRQVGLDPVVQPAAIDESIPDGLSPVAAALHLANEKAAAVAALVAMTSEAGDETAPSVILAADTIVEIGGVALGKPTDDADARRMLRLLSGRTHQVHTGVCLIASGGDPACATATTAVTMRPLSEEEIESYVATGEAEDAAGSYAIQGRAGMFVTSIDGEYSNVVGLPLAVVGCLFNAVGQPVHQLWSPP